MKKLHIKSPNNNSYDKRRLEVVINPELGMIFYLWDDRVFDAPSTGKKLIFINSIHSNHGIQIDYREDVWNDICADCEFVI